MTLWSRIADTLRREIAEGARPAGSKLPTEAELAARFGVNRHTVRRAIATLIADGLVHSRRGAGTFVTAVPTDYTIGLRPRFRQSMRAAGRIPGRRLLSLETRPATSAEAAPLALDAGAPIHIAEGLAIADDQPVAVYRSLYPAERLPDLPAALRECGSVTTALAACGISDYHRISTRLVAVPASEAEARHLMVSVGAPLLLSDSLNADADGQVVEHGLTRFAGERITLTLDHS